MLGPKDAKKLNKKFGSRCAGDFPARSKCLFALTRTLPPMLLSLLRFVLLCLSYCSAVSGFALPPVLLCLTVSFCAASVTFVVFTEESDHPDMSSKQMFS